LLADSFWLIHNEQKHDKFIFLQGAMQTSPELDSNYYKPLFKFIQSYGGDFIYWKKNADIRWFGVDESHNLYESYPPEMENIQIPDHIFTSRFNKDSLLEIRHRISLIKKNRSLPWDSARRANEIYIRERLEEYGNSIRSEKPFLYHIKARLSITKIFFINSRANNPFSQRENIFVAFLNHFYSFYYLAIIFLGLLGCAVLSFYSIKRRHFLIFPAIPVYTVAVHALLLRLIENRYFIPAYPFLLACAAFFILFVIDKGKLPAR
jgi:hypothetical protein